MYLYHFGLRELPFMLTPNTGFYCALTSHQEALATLITLCIQVLVRVDLMLVVGGVFVATAGAGGLLAQQRWFKTRRELLFFLLPVASLLISSALALSGLIRAKG